MRKTAIHPLLSESDMRILWLRGLFRQDGLRTEDSRGIRIEFPGIPGTRGPDFRNARIRIEGELAVGDVELHLTPSGWRLHRHEKDLSYANVILHVALFRQGDGPPPAAATGRRIPELVLEPFLERSMAELAEEIRRNWPQDRGETGDLGRLLDSEGDDRLYRKTTRVRTLLASLPPSEVLYRELLSALGASENRALFEAVAERVPEALLRGRPEEETTAAMLFAAGLAASRPPWLALDSGLDPALWRRAGLRPCNFPERRLRGASALVASAGPAGILAAWEAVLLDGPVGDGGARLVRWLRSRGRPWIGTGRALQLAADVLVPFFTVRFAEQREYELAAAVRDLWKTLPAPPDSFPTRYVKEMIWGDAEDTGLVSNFRRHQGLLGLYRKMLAG